MNGNDFFQQAMEAIKVGGAPSPTAPAVASYLQSDFAAAPTAAVASAGAGRGAQIEASRKQAEANSIQEKKDRAALIEKNLKGEDWEQVKKDDGGYDYYDALGNKVDLWTFSKYTKKDPRKLLSDSQNRLDQQFNEDWDNTEEMMKAYAGGTQNEFYEKLKKKIASNIEIPADIGDDEDKIADWIAEQTEREAQLIRQKIEEGGGPSTILQRFKQHYPNVFGQEGRGQVDNRFSR